MPGKTYNIFDFDQTLTQHHTFSEFCLYRYPDASIATHAGQANAKAYKKKDAELYLKHDLEHFSAIATYHNNPAFIAGFITEVLGKELTFVETVKPVASDAPGTAINRYTIADVDTPFFISYISEVGEAFDATINQLTGKNNQISSLKRLFLEEKLMEESSIINFYEDSKGNFDKASLLKQMNCHLIEASDATFKIVRAALCRIPVNAEGSHSKELLSSSAHADETKTTSIPPLILSKTPQPLTDSARLDTDGDTVLSPILSPDFKSGSSLLSRRASLRYLAEQRLVTIESNIREETTPKAATSEEATLERSRDMPSTQTETDQQANAENPSSTAPPKDVQLIIRSSETEPLPKTVTSASTERVPCPREHGGHEKKFTNRANSPHLGHNGDSEQTQHPLELPEAPIPPDTTIKGTLIRLATLKLTEDFASIKPHIKKLLKHIENLIGHESDEMLLNAVEQTYQLLHNPNSSLDTYRATANNMIGKPNQKIYNLGISMLALGTAIAVIIATASGHIVLSAPVLALASASAFIIGGYSLFTGRGKGPYEEMHEIADKEGARRAQTI